LIFSEQQVSLAREAVTETVKRGDADGRHVAYKQINKIRKQNVEDESASKETQTSTEDATATDGPKTVSYAPVQRSRTTEVIYQACCILTSSMFSFYYFYMDVLKCVSQPKIAKNKFTRNPILGV